MSGRPLQDDGWGPRRAARRAHRLAGYLTASRLRLDTRGRAEARIDFTAAAGKGIARTEAAQDLAARYGVETRGIYRITRSTYSGEERIVREPRALTVHGEAETVARFVAALPRVLDYAEKLATLAAHSYGDWSRRPLAEPHLEYLDAAGRRAQARAFRAAAFRVAARILAAAEDTVDVPAVDVTLAPWQQVEAIAGGIAAYGWVDVTEAADPAEAAQLLAAAHRPDALDALHEAEVLDLAVRRAERTAALRDALDAEQLELFPAPVEEPAVEEPVAAGAVTGPVVVIPCSGRKLARAAEAGHLYTGPLHVHARRTADALTAAGGTVLVLSALHGLLPLDQVIEPYDHQWKDPGSITEAELIAQAAELGIAGAADVVLLTPGEYTRRAARVWPHARTPLAHLGIGSQRGRLTALRERPEQYVTAA
ncbi:DUF6884 domain-containing protein [Streptomyces sp. NPDC056528]|uniref:DUF6884 domain-containing protein n=1 Tax=Streptomyces sp. NPDC056528 TaxID=3345854 RepID=UPI0036C95115